MKIVATQLNRPSLWIQQIPLEVPALDGTRQFIPGKKAFTVTEFTIGNENKAFDAVGFYNELWIEYLKEVWYFKDAHVMFQIGERQDDPKLIITFSFCRIDSNGR